MNFDWKLIVSILIMLAFFMVFIPGKPRQSHGSGGGPH